jgi:hypothetical protein
MSNSYGNTPRPHQGMRERRDRDGALPESTPDCEQAVADCAAEKERAAGQVHLRTRR